jgi:hypothetical protein
LITGHKPENAYVTLKPAQHLLTGSTSVDRLVADAPAGCCAPVGGWSKVYSDILKVTEGYVYYVRPRNGCTRKFDNVSLAVHKNSKYGKVMIFEHPVKMVIDASRSGGNERTIKVRGTMYDVLRSIYKAYKMPATKIEKRVAFDNDDGPSGPRLIDQMSDKVYFEGWNWYDDKKRIAFMSWDLKKTCYGLKQLHITRQVVYYKIKLTIL